MVQARADVAMWMPAVSLSTEMLPSLSFRDCINTVVNGQHLVFRYNEKVIHHSFPNYLFIILFHFPNLHILT